MTISDFPFFSLQDRAKELADTVGGDALSLADLNSFHPENGMILANTTSVGMQPKVDETPVSKVCPFVLCSMYFCLLKLLLIVVV